MSAWSDPSAQPNGACARRIFLPTIDARLIALDAANGKPCQDFGAGGTIAPAIVRDLARLNLFFAGLNAIPGFPLDGGRMLLATAWGVSGSRRTGLRVVGFVGLGLGAVCAGLAVIAFTNQNDWWFIPGYLAFLLVPALAIVGGVVLLASSARRT